MFRPSASYLIASISLLLDLILSFFKESTVSKLRVSPRNLVGFQNSIFIILFLKIPTKLLGQDPICLLCINISSLQYYSSEVIVTIRLIIELQLEMNVKKYKLYIVFSYYIEFKATVTQTFSLSFYV